MDNSLVLVAHNLRSAHNVGSILRSADAFAIDQVFLTGYTPYPVTKNDSRLPHLAAKIDRQIAKTALGAEKTVDTAHAEDIRPVIKELKASGYEIAALEQTSEAETLQSYKPAAKVALIVGREVEGIEDDILRLADKHIEIPMSGSKESLNVAVAAAIAMHWLKNLNNA
jgi:23S rRNA (guanosine2251-2'-O)-methyltransferase